MAYQNPYTGEWYTDDGIPFSQAGEGQPLSYLPGYMPQQDPSNPYVSPQTGQQAYSSWPDYQDGYGGAPAPAPYAAPTGGDPAPDPTNPTPPPAQSGDPGAGQSTSPSNPYAYSDGDANPFTFDPVGFEWPVFQAPDAFKYDPFQAPSMQDAENEPGYAFSRDQGVKALENSAAARGTLRTGGTLKDILGFGQKLGQQNYSNVFNRGLDVYNTNRNNAADIYQRNYNSSRDVFASKQSGAQNTFNALLQQWRDSLQATSQLANTGAGL